MRRHWRRTTTVLCGLIFIGASSTTSSGARKSGSGGLFPDRPQDVQVVDVTAERFSFTPSEIRTRVGVPIEIRLRSEDTDHGFRILGTKIDVRLPKRNKGTISVTFE